MRDLLRRVTLRSALAAFMPLLVSVVFVTVEVFGWDWGGRFGPHDLELALTYELILIHAYAFIGLGLVAQPETLWGRALRALFCWGMIALYIYTAHREDGRRGVETLLGLGLATYPGVLLGLVSERVLTGIGTRWLVNMLTLLFVVAVPIGLWLSIVHGQPTQSIPEVPEIGMAYFAVIAAFEAFRLYDWMEESERRRKGIASSPAPAAQQP